jgi:tetratricopeptide (TPR) repeat protein
MATTDALTIASLNITEGNLEAAEQHLWSILARNSNDPEALRLYGSIARERGDWDQALDYLNRSLLCNRTDAVTWKNLGDVHFFARNYREAAAHYEHALLLRPDYGDAYNKLGIALDYLGDVQGALTVFETGLRAQPDCPELASNFGTFLHKEGKLDRAAELFRQALRLRPNYAEASNKLATILKERGLLDAAIAQFQETLKIQPDQALAHYHLSEFAAEGRYEVDAEHLQRIKRYLQSRTHAPLERSHLSFALAALLGKQGAYDEAFHYYKQANDLRKSLLIEGTDGFDVQTFADMIDGIIATRGSAYFDSVKDWGVQSEVPVFIVGMPRSGSSLVEQILASHPHVFGAGEICDIQKFLMSRTGEANPRVLLNNRHTTGALANAYLEYLTDLSKNTARVTIKTLSNFLHLADIATLFPTARIIHCRRHPLDLCLSCYFQNFKDMPFAWNLEDIGTCYRAYDKLMAHWSRVLPLPIHEVRYEELVDNQESVTRKLLDFCGLDWDERCLAFFKTRRVVRTASTIQVRKPISRQAIGRWQHFRSHLGPLFAALAWPPDKDTW